MMCKYCVEEICVNDECPMRADYCPVPNDPGVCKFEEMVPTAVEKAWQEGAEAMKAAIWRLIKEHQSILNGVHKATLEAVLYRIKDLELDYE